LGKWLLTKAGGGWRGPDDGYSPRRRVRSSLSIAAANFTDRFNQALGSELEA